MAQKVGTIYVDLVANTSAFIDDLGKAGAAARRAGKNIEGALGKLGSIAGTALAPFGQMGSTIASLFGAVGSAAGGAMKNVSKMGSVTAAVGLGAAGAITAVVGAVGGLAAHAAFGAASLGKLAQSAGVSVEALSGLAFAAKQSPEELAASLAKLSKSVFAAATAPAGAVNAYKRLGVAVKDASGQIRPTEEILLDIAAKFKTMPDGPTKTALAMQLFGKSGAEMIPFLNKGRDGIGELTKKAQELGITIDGKTAASAQAFKKSMGMMEAAGAGLTNKLMADLLPAFNAATKGIVGGLEKQGSTWNWLVKILGGAVKASITLLDALLSAVHQVVQTFIAMVRVISYGEMAAWDAVKALAHGDLSGAKNAISQFYDDARREGSHFLSESGQLWKDFGQRVVETYSPIPDAADQRPKPGSGTDGVDTSAHQKAKKEKKQREDPTREALADLQQRLRASQELLAVSTKDELATKQQTAANKADAEILKLGEQIAKQRNKTTQDYASMVDAATQADIRKKEAQIAENEITAELNKTIASGTRQSSAAIAQANALTAAIKRGAEAIADANAYAQAENELRDKGASQEQIAIRAGQILNEEKAKAQASTQQRIEDTRYELQWQERLNAALLQGADAYRAAQLAKAKADIDRAGQGTPEQRDELKRQADDKSRLDREAEQIEKQKQAAQKVQDSLKDAWQGFNDNLARILTGQKASWESFFRDISMRLAQSGLKQAERGIAQAFGIKLKADGTVGNPFYVHVVNQLASANSPVPGAGSKPANSADTVLKDSPLGTLSTKLSSVFSRISGALKSIFHSIGGVLGKVFGGMFGGFFAEGGDPDPYKISVIGEKGPELFNPGVRGHITSNRDLRKMLGGNVAYYSVDARGTNAAEVEMRMQRVLGVVHDSAIRQGVMAQRETQLRRPRSQF